MGKVTLYLMTKKGLSVLERLVAIDKAHLIDFVVIGSDKNVLEDYSNAMEKHCEKSGITFFSKKSAPHPSSKYSLAISWRWIIEPTDSRLIVLHDSILPAYRGFAPLVNQLVNGEEVTGVTALFAVEAYDKGPIIGQNKMPLEYPLKIEKAIDLISALYADLVESIFNKIEKNQPLPEMPQDESKASYSLWRDEEDYLIDWTGEAEKIRRHIDAVGFPYQGALTFVDKKAVRIIEAEEIPDLNIENRHTGKVIFFKDDRPVVVCGSGLIKIINAVYDKDRSSIFPLKRFRIRFK